MLANGAFGLSMYVVPAVSKLMLKYVLPYQEESSRRPSCLFPPPPGTVHTTVYRGDTNIRTSHDPPCNLLPGEGKGRGEDSELGQGKGMSGVGQLTEGGLGLLSGTFGTVQEKPALPPRVWRLHLGFVQLDGTLPQARTSRGRPRHSPGLGTQRDPICSKRAGCTIELGNWLPGDVSFGNTHGALGPESCAGEVRAQLSFWHGPEGR